MNAIDRLYQLEGFKVRCLVRVVDEADPLGIENIADVPPWIDQDITCDQVAAILQGGCASGAYMPAVTYRKASATMAQHGDDVLDYLGDRFDTRKQPSTGRMTNDDTGNEAPRMVAGGVHGLPVGSGPGRGRDGRGRPGPRIPTPAYAGGSSGLPGAGSPGVRDTDGGRGHRDAAGTPSSQAGCPVGGWTAGGWLYRDGLRQAQTAPPLLFHKTLTHMRRTERVE